VPDIFLGPGESSKQIKNPCLHGAYIPVIGGGGDTNEQTVAEYRLRISGLDQHLLEVLRSQTLKSEMTGLADVHLDVGCEEKGARNYCKIF
jgi:hypothetical protein